MKKLCSKKWFHLCFKALKIFHPPISIRHFPLQIQFSTQPTLKPNTFDWSLKTLNANSVLYIRSFSRCKKCRTRKFFPLEKLMLKFNSHKNDNNFGPDMTVFINISLPRFFFYYFCVLGKWKVFFFLIYIRSKSS